MIGILGWEGWARTNDPVVNSHLLYQLSYFPMGRSIPKG